MRLSAGMSLSWRKRISETTKEARIARVAITPGTTAPALCRPAGAWKNAYKVPLMRNLVKRAIRGVVGEEAV